MPGLKPWTPFPVAVNIVITTTYASIDPAVITLEREDAKLEGGSHVGTPA